LVTAIAIPGKIGLLQLQGLVQLATASAIPGKIDLQQLQGLV
jgi:hypothetical protein